MLRSMRDGAKSGYLKFILLGLMALAVGGLVLTDVGGFFRGGVSANLVAKGDGIKISTVEFDRSVRRILSRQGLSAQEAYQRGMIHQILSQEIETQILTREAQKMGVRVGDETVTNHIAKLAEPLASKGVSRKAALMQILRSQGISEGEFIAAIRQEMGITLFRAALSQGEAAISENQAEDLYQFRNEKREFDGIVLKNKDVKDVTAPTEEQLQQYYEANKPQFLISEKRDITIATLTAENIAKKINITDEELRTVYEDKIDSFKTDERRQLQQAILPTEQDAKNVIEATNSGNNLKAAVQKVTKSENAYIGENEFAEKGMQDNIAKPVFKAAKGDVVGPIQSPLGWHVVVVKDIIAPATTSFDKVKDGLKNSMMQTRLMGDLESASNTLDDRLASGESLDAVAKDMGLTTKTYKGFSQSGMTEDGKDVFEEFTGSKADVLDAAFDFNVGESSPVMPMDDGSFVTVHVDHVQERAYQTFDSVKSKLSARWMDEQRSAMNKARAQDAYSLLQKDGSSLSDVAKEYGVSVQTFKNLDRMEKPAEPLSALAVRNIFNAEEGAKLSLPIENGFVIGQVSAINLPDAKSNNKDIKLIKEQVSESLAEESMAQYVSALSAKYNVKINDRVLQQIYGDPVTN